MPVPIPDQLLGAARVLRDAVAPAVDDPYAADVLRGVISTIETLSSASSTLPAFLAWDIAETAAVLRSVGVEPPAFTSSPSSPTRPASPVDPVDPVDPVELDQWHRATRAALETAIPIIRQDPAATAATVALFRARAARYPLAAQYRR